MNPRNAALIYGPACLVALCSLAGADDWPQFGRDGTRNAVSPERNPPTNWSLGQLDEEHPPSRIAGTQRNIKWSARLGSQTYGDPVVVDGLVWVGTNNADLFAKNEQPDASVLACFREGDGKLLYRHVSPRLPQGRVHDWPMSSMACSPFVENDRLWLVTNRAEVVCLDIAPLKTGAGEPKQTWTIDLMAQYGVFPQGSKMALMHFCSIAGYKDYLYVNTGNGANEGMTIPKPDAPSLLCLRKDTGALVWQDKSPGENIIDGQWSSPTVVEINGRMQCIVAQGDGWVRSFDALSGRPIWQFDVNPKEARSTISGHSTRNGLPASPVFADGRIYIASGQSSVFGEGLGRLVCIDPTREGDISSELAVSAEGKVIPQRRLQAVDPAKGEKAIPNSNSGLVWEFSSIGDGKEYVNQMHRTMANVAVHSGLAIATDFSGVIHCLDARTGQHYWGYDSWSGIYGSPLIVDGKIYVAGEEGVVSVFGLSADPNKAMRKLRSGDAPLRSVEMDEPIYCSLVFAKGVLYLATRHELFALAAGLDEPNTELTGGYWPQWRGPNRDNVSTETGLLQEWPADGPPRPWTADGLGEGIASVAVAEGKVFTLGYRRESEFVVALDEVTGELAWSTRIGPAVAESPLMRWLTQRVPTVDVERLYALTANGDLVCLRTFDGKELWRKSYAADFGAQRPLFGFGDHPLVDADTLVCSPGGATGQIASLDKRTGNLRWALAIPGADAPRHDYAGLMGAGFGEPGFSVYVAFADHRMAVISARDGRLLWHCDKAGSANGESQTPIVRGDQLFYCDRDRGEAALLKLVRNGNDVTAEKQYRYRICVDGFQDCTLLVGDRLFVATGPSILRCFDWTTGTPVWAQRIAAGKLSFTYADGRFYLRGSEGEMLLCEATPKKLLVKGSFAIPDHEAAMGSTMPVVAGGRLYLRDNTRLHCYDVRAAGEPHGPGLRTASVTVPLPAASYTNAPRAADERKPPQGVFVPTPHDVANRMLDLAQITKADLVCDLGCGDGRIVVAAAKQFGCRAIGYDLDRELVALARQKAAAEGVENLVTIERADALGVDLSKIDVVTLYLLPEQNKKLLAQLQKMKPGSRIVSHQFPLPGITPDSKLTVESDESGESHLIYLYTVPPDSSRLREKSGRGETTAK